MQLYLPPYFPNRKTYTTPCFTVTAAEYDHFKYYCEKVRFGVRLLEVAMCRFINIYFVTREAINQT